MPSTVLGARDIILNKANEVPCPHGTYILGWVGVEWIDKQSK